MKHYLAIDVGGTHIKYALMQEDGAIISSDKMVTPKRSLEAFLTSLFDIITPYQEELSGVAFSVPGKVDTHTGTIYFGGALTYLDRLCLKQVIQERYNLPASVQNDAKAAALAELWLGSLKGVSDAAVIVLGTGVGGGIILDGQLRMGPHFQAGELSLSVLEASKPEVEKMVGFIGSAVLMIEKVNQAIGHPDLKDGQTAFQAISKGDTRALPIFQTYCRQIAYLILNLQAFLDLSTYAIGGGISSQPLLIEEINRQFSKVIEGSPLLSMNVADLAIIPTHFGNDANLYGALYQFLEEHNNLSTDKTVSITDK
ncbi:ROK family protein [Streptococcus suis]|nr:ROK family protein [Streptococcus suis]NQM38108.1 ROK family protein [Streptococcus suis]UUM62961.1 ROK family protein [Streptococcus suis]